MFALMIVGQWFTQPAAVGQWEAACQLADARKVPLVVVVHSPADVRCEPCELLKVRIRRAGWFRRKDRVVIEVPPSHWAIEHLKVTTWPTVLAYRNPRKAGIQVQGTLSVLELERALALPRSNPESAEAARVNEDAGSSSPRAPDNSLVRVAIPYTVRERVGCRRNWRGKQVCSYRNVTRYRYEWRRQ